MAWLRISLEFFKQLQTAEMQLKIIWQFFQVPWDKLCRGKWGWCMSVSLAGAQGQEEKMRKPVEYMIEFEIQGKLPKFVS